MKILHSKLKSLLVILYFHLLRLIASQGEQICKTQDGRDGFCINLKSQIKFCPKFYALLQSGHEGDWERLRRAFCGKNISKDHARICCPLDSYEETPSKLMSNPVEPDHSKHPNFKLLPGDIKCGFLRLDSRIIGGKNAGPGDFPWMARISLSQRSNIKTPPSFGCSGTIINNRYILTAAHCLQPVVSGSHNLSIIRLAETDENVNPESITDDGFVVATSPYLDYEHEEFIVHPNYTGTTGSPHDIALIRLKKIIDTSSEFTRPVCLPFVKEYYVEGSLMDEKLLRQNGTVCGWGKTNSSASIGSSILQYVTVPIHSNILCRIVYQKSFNITNSQICAGSQNGQNSCSGDSGGPLTRVTHPDDPNTKAKSYRHFQIGIVSFGKVKCAATNEPVVYTRVRNYLTWILDNIRE